MRDLTDSSIALSRNGSYKIRVLTRNASSPDAKRLSTLPGVSILEGNAYDEASLDKAFTGIDSVFINTNGFAIGEKAEIYWGIRLYEIARQHHVKHFVYAGLLYASKLSDFDPELRCGHLDGKGKVVQYLKSQPITPMAWSVITSCLYAEMLSEKLLLPREDSEGTAVFSLPVGDAKVPLIHLDDYGKYVCWIIDHPERSTGLELTVATEDIAWKDLAAAFSEVTGRKAIYKEISMDELFAGGYLPPADAKLGHSNKDEETLQTVRQNFEGFWKFWKAELSRRDYELLDEILPDRVKSIKQWMVKVGYTGKESEVSVLKDGRK